MYQYQSVILIQLISNLLYFIIYESKENLSYFKQQHKIILSVQDYQAMMLIILSYNQALPAFISHLILITILYLSIPVANLGQNQYHLILYHDIHFLQIMLIYLQSYLLQYLYHYLIYYIQNLIRMNLFHFYQKFISFMNNVNLNPLIDGAISIQIKLEIQQMGACAGCVGPQRRDQKYRVNRLTQNAPIRNLVSSSSQLPLSRNRDRIIDGINEQKRKFEQNNLLSTLINSPSNPQGLQKSSYSPVKLIRNSFNDSPEYPSRDSFEQNIRGSNMFKLKKIQSNSFINENTIDKVIIDRPFSSDYRNENGLTYNSKILSQIKMNQNIQYNFKRKQQLSNIPQLIDQQSRTPGYVKQIRKKNGQDVKRTDLEMLPRILESPPKINIHHYLKDLL